MQEAALEPALVSGVALKVVSRRGQQRADRARRDPPRALQLELLHGRQAAGKSPVREAPPESVPEAQPGRIESELLEGRPCPIRREQDADAQNPHENSQWSIHISVQNNDRSTSLSGRQSTRLHHVRSSPSFHQARQRREAEAIRPALEVPRAQLIGAEVFDLFEPDRAQLCAERRQLEVGQLRLAARCDDSCRVVVPRAVFLPPSVAGGIA